MPRAAAIGFLITAILATLPAAWAGPASTAPPVTYEVQINGESFPVEANRVVKVESKQKPGVSYNVAVRVAPTQQVRLNTIQFEYELPAKVEDSGKRENRSARLTHELGFSILLERPWPAVGSAGPGGDVEGAGRLGHRGIAGGEGDGDRR